MAAPEIDGLAVSGGRKSEVEIEIERGRGRQREREREGERDSARVSKRE